MAIINSYPGITPTAEDLLLICDTSVEGNPTKTASVNSVLALIPSGSGGGGIANITSSNSNFLTVTNPDGSTTTTTTTRQRTYIGRQIGNNPVRPTQGESVAGEPEDGF